MAAILTREFRTNNLASYIYGFFSASSTTPMYMWFGRGTAWPLDANGKAESEDGFILPAPNSNTSSANFRLNAIAGTRIVLSEVCPVVERVNWSTGKTYLTDTVVITDEWNVYIAKRNVTSNTKPTHINTNASNLDWKFLYKITEPNMFSNFVTDEWIPVYFEGNVGNSGVPDQLAIYTVKCITLMISKSMNTSILSPSELADFRQIALWSAILNNSGVQQTTSKLLASGINKNSGTIVYVDNRLPLYRSIGQTEDYRILIGF